MNKEKERQKNRPTFPLWPWRLLALCVRFAPPAVASAVPAGGGVRGAAAHPGRGQVLLNLCPKEEGPLRVAGRLSLQRGIPAQ